MSSIVPKLPTHPDFEVVDVFAAADFGWAYLIRDTDHQWILEEFLPSAETLQDLATLQVELQSWTRPIQAIESHQIAHSIAFLNHDERLFWLREYTPTTAYQSLLEEAIQQNETFSEAEIWDFLIAVLEPLAQIHDQQVAHGAIDFQTVTCRNDDDTIVLQRAGRIREFGLANHFYLLQPLTPPSWQTELRGMTQDLHDLAWMALVLLTGHQTINVTPSTIHELEHKTIISDELARILTQMLFPKAWQQFTNARIALQAVQAELPDFETLEETSAIASTPTPSTPPLRVKSPSSQATAPATPQAMMPPTANTPYSNIYDSGNKSISGNTTLTDHHQPQSYDNDHDRYRQDNHKQNYNRPNQISDFTRDPVVITLSIVFIGLVTLSLWRIAQSAKIPFLKPNSAPTKPIGKFSGKTATNGSARQPNLVTIAASQASSTQKSGQKTSRLVSQSPKPKTQNQTLGKINSKSPKQNNPNTTKPAQQPQITQGIPTPLYQQLTQTLNKSTDKSPTKIDRVLRSFSETARREIGRYQRSDYDHWVATLASRRISQPTIDILTDATFDMHFPGLQKTLRKSTSFRQLWYAIARDHITALNQKQNLKVLKAGTFNETGKLPYGRGRVFQVTVPTGQGLRLYLKTRRKDIRLSVLENEIVLTRYSRNTQWTTPKSKRGAIYEIILTPRQFKPVPYKLSLKTM